MVNLNFSKIRFKLFDLCIKKALTSGNIGSDEL